MSKHTPGPWTLELVDTSIGTCFTIGPFPSQGFTGEARACIYVDGINRREYGRNSIADELRANAHLIAAAPDLLEACEEFVRKVENGEARSTRSYQQMKAAIAKAKGEQI